MSKQFVLSYVASVDLSHYADDCDTPEEVIEVLKSHFDNNVGHLLDENGTFLFQTALVQEVIDEDTTKLLSVAWIKPEWSDQ